MSDIIVKNLRLSFGERRVLWDFSARFAAGRTSLIMGPSGCGKTTLLRALMGLLPPDGGSIEGVPPRKSAVFQEDRLCEDFTLLSNVRLAAGKRVSRAAALEALSELGLEGEADKKAGELSGGMKRRAALARAVLCDADILFLDEAFKGLDGETRRQAMDYLIRHTAGKTLIAVTHDEAEAACLGGEVLRMTNIDGTAKEAD